MVRKLLPVAFVFATASGFAAQWDQRIVEVRSGQTLRFEDLSEKLKRVDRLVIGEKHNTEAVQLAEARVLEAFTSAEPWFLGWEFLSFSEQNKTAEAYSRFVRGELTGVELLKATQGSDSNRAYLPVLERLKSLGGGLLGVNLTRQEKAPVVRSGIGAADPSLIPPGFEMGRTGYRDRFIHAMSQGHATPEQIENYYAAQCLTDDVMAYHLSRLAAGTRAVLIAGSFHTDFYDGVVNRVRNRQPGVSTALLRVVDASDYLEAELAAVGTDPVYGDLADYLFIVNEPGLSAELPQEAPVRPER